MGLVTSLTDRGLKVVDYGDLPRVEYRPDPIHTTARNGELVAQVALEVASRVGIARADGALPVVLGGDCTITLGVVAGLLDRDTSIGVLYFDGDLDLNTPETTHTGILDGMVTAHLLGRGLPALARLGPRFPLLDEDQLVYLGYNEKDGGIDPPELSALARMTAPHFSLEEIRRAPVEMARQAVRALEDRVERILVHFDVDVTHTPAVDVAHPSGLSLDTAFRVLEELLGSPRLAGLVITEFNPRRDVDGEQAVLLVEGLSSAIGSALSFGAPPPEETAGTEP